MLAWKLTLAMMAQKFYIWWALDTIASDGPWWCKALWIAYRGFGLDYIFTYPALTGKVTQSTRLSLSLPVWRPWRAPRLLSWCKLGSSYWAMCVWSVQRGRRGCGSSASQTTSSESNPVSFPDHLSLCPAHLVSFPNHLAWFPDYPSSFPNPLAWFPGHSAVLFESVKQKEPT